MKEVVIWHGSTAIGLIKHNLNSKLVAAGKHLQTAIKLNISTPSYKRKKNTSRKRQVGKLRGGKR